MTRRSTLADLFCSLTFLAVTAVSTVAQAAIVPTSGASFVKADWSLASHQDDGGITWTIPGIAYVGSTPAGGASIGLSPRIPGSSTLFGQDALYVDLLTSYHQIAFELFTGNSANRTILTLAGDGAFYIPLDIPSNGSIWVDIYSVNPITRLTLAPLTRNYPPPAIELGFGGSRPG
jgi:hypothetical protein